MSARDDVRPHPFRGPAIILVGTQLGENIGTAARAMLNFGLNDLRLVAPKAGWPNVKALNAAAGADEVIAQVRTYGSVAEAIADLETVYATTARPRDLAKPVIDGARAARAAREAERRGGRSGFLFGPERTGLDNEATALADAIVSIPLNPEFSSLNVAQAVLLIAYEWFRADSGAASRGKPALRPHARPATKGEFDGFMRRLTQALDEAGFFASPKMRPVMLRNLRTYFARGAPSEQELRTLYGVIERLRRPKRRAGAAEGRQATPR
ncbi:MAG TPA: RNA methyltransferase [Alphaproteobacteria bacterium]|nr:RNA methyltransferase [Alphaproteobacteria bacterium]